MKMHACSEYGANLLFNCLGEGNRKRLMNYFREKRMLRTYFFLQMQGIRPDGTMVSIEEGRKNAEKGIIAVLESLKDERYAAKLKEFAIRRGLCIEKDYNENTATH